MTRLPESVKKLIGNVESTAEMTFLNRVQWLGLPKPETQVKLIEGRRYRWDFVFSEQKIAVEIQGGTFNGGRHTRGAGYESDCTKLALAQIAGYAVLYFTPQMVSSGVAGALLLEAMRARGWKG